VWILKSYRYQFSDFSGLPASHVRALVRYNVIDLICRDKATETTIIYCYLDWKKKLEAAIISKLIIAVIFIGKSGWCI